MQVSLVVGLDIETLSQAPWGMLSALYPQTKWYGSASCEGKTPTKHA